MSYSSQSRSHSQSHSTSSSSLYMTPMNSPISSCSQSVTFADMLSLDSTNMDLTFSTEQTPDTEPTHTEMHDRCRLLSSTSVSSESTIKCSSADNVVRNASTQLTICANNSYDNYNLLLKYLNELESEHIELVGIEQKINLIGLQCKRIREKSLLKTNSLFAIIEDLRNKCAIQTSDAQTQTNDQTITNTRTHSCMNYGNQIKSNTCQQIESHSKQIKLLDKDLSPLIKHKLRRLPALIKGYLVRRLMQTEKVTNTLQTIYDTTHLLINFKLDTNSREITNEDINLHKRLIIQLDNACSCYYDIFINYSKRTQMAIIAQSRDNLLSRHFRNSSSLSTTSHTILTADNSFSNGLSSVTRKKLKNKMTAKIDLNKTYSCEPKTKSITGRSPMKKVLSKSNKM